MTDSTQTRRRWIVVALLCCLLMSLIPSPAAAVTGNDWRRLSSAAKTAYVSGVVDTLMDFGAAVRSLVPAEKRSASEKTLVSFEDCVGKTPRLPRHLVAIVDRYVKENPAERYARMSALVFEALRCKSATATPPRSKGE
jgi:hypothetical protein